MYTAMDIANYIVAKCIRDDERINNLRLQGILYYAQREFLKNGSCLFMDDFEAWATGPVIPKVYYNFCGYGAMPISFEHKTCEIDFAHKAVIDGFVETKRLLQPWDITEEINKDGMAWSIVYKNGAGRRKAIPKELIKTYG